MSRLSRCPFEIFCYIVARIRRCRDEKQASRTKYHQQCHVFETNRFARALVFFQKLRTSLWKSWNKEVFNVSPGNKITSFRNIANLAHLLRTISVLKLKEIIFQSFSENEVFVDNVNVVFPRHREYKNLLRTDRPTASWSRSFIATSQTPPSTVSCTRTRTVL